MRCCLFVIIVISYSLMFVGSAFSASSVSPGSVTVDFTLPLLDVDGKNQAKDDFQKSLDDPECKKCDPLTLGIEAARCIVADKSTPPDQKPAVFVLAGRIRNNKEAALSAEEVVTIKKCVENNFPAWIAAPILNVIAPATK